MNYPEKELELDELEWN